jgi:hypothetical protein
MRKGNFTTYPDVNKALISLQKYLRRLKTDVVGIKPKILKNIDTTLAKGPGTVSPAQFQKMAESHYDTFVQLFEKISAEDVADF